jgi:hypothetical protein
MEVRVRRLVAVTRLANIPQGSSNLLSTPMCRISKQLSVSESKTVFVVKLARVFEDADGVRSHV